MDVSSGQFLRDWPFSIIMLYLSRGSALYFFFAEYACQEILSDRHYSAAMTANYYEIS